MRKGKRGEEEMSSQPKKKIAGDKMERERDKRIKVISKQVSLTYSLSTQTQREKELKFPQVRKNVSPGTIPKTKRANKKKKK